MTGRPNSSPPPPSDTPPLDHNMNHPGSDPAREAPTAAPAVAPLVQPARPTIEATSAAEERPSLPAVPTGHPTGSASDSEASSMTSEEGTPAHVAGASAAAAADTTAHVLVEPPLATATASSPLAEASRTADAMPAIATPSVATYRTEPTEDLAGELSLASTVAADAAPSAPELASSTATDTPVPPGEEAHHLEHDELLASLSHAAERSRAMFGNTQPPPVFFPLSAASVRQDGPVEVIEFHPGRLDPTLVQRSPPPPSAPQSSPGESQSALASTAEPASIPGEATDVPEPTPGPSSAQTSSEPSSSMADAEPTPTAAFRPSPVPPMSAQIRRIADVRLARVQGIHVGAPEDARLAEAVRALFVRAAYMPVHPIFIPSNASTLPFACLYDPLTELAWPLLPFDYDRSTPEEEIRQRREQLLVQQQRPYASAPAPLLVRFQLDNVAPFFPPGQTGSRLDHARAARAAMNASPAGSSPGQDTTPLPGEEHPQALRHLISGHPFRVSILFLHTPEELATMLSSGNQSPPEQPDPAKARSFVDGLERVDAELRTRMGRLGMGDIGDVSGDSAEATTLGCGICLEPYETEDRPGWLAESEQEAYDAQVVGIPCPGHHVVHAGCLREWLAATRPSEWSCPFCRAHLDDTHTHIALSSKAKAAAGAMGRSVREEVRFRERAHGWRCDAPACLPRYPDDNPTTADGMDRVPDDYTVLGRLLSLTPCHHQIHLDCMLTSLRVTDEQRFDEDDSDLEEEVEEQEEVMQHVSPPQPASASRAAHSPEQGQTNVAHLYNLLGGHRRPLRMSSWPMGLHYGASSAFPHDPASEPAGTRPRPLEQARFALPRTRAQSQIRTGAEAGDGPGTDIGKEEPDMEPLDLDDVELTPVEHDADAATPRPSAPTRAAETESIFSRTRSGQLKVRGRWVSCPVCRREVWAEIPLLRRPKEQGLCPQASGDDARGEKRACSTSPITETGHTDHFLSRRRTDPVQTPPLEPGKQS